MCRWTAVRFFFSGSLPGPCAADACSSPSAKDVRRPVPEFLLLASLAYREEPGMRSCRCSVRDASEPVRSWSRARSHPWLLELPAATER